MLARPAIFGSKFTQDTEDKRSDEPSSEKHTPRPMTAERSTFGCIGLVFSADSKPGGGISQQRG